MLALGKPLESHSAPLATHHQVLVPGNLTEEFGVGLC